MHRQISVTVLIFALSVTFHLSAQVSNTKAAPSKEKRTGSPIKTAGQGSSLKKISSWEQAQDAGRQFIEQKPNGSINWTEQIIEAKGEAAIDNDRFKNPAQARLMAQRGAVVVAQRNLLEIIKGVNVTGETTVEDMITTRDFIYSRVDGVIKGAQLVGEPVLKDGFVEVRMRVKMYEASGLAPAIIDELPGVGSDSSGNPQGGESPRSDSESNDNGGKFVADTTGKLNKPMLFNIVNPKDWKPSMFPVITDEKGNLVLNLASVYDPAKGKFPEILGLAKEVFSRAGWTKGAEVVDLVAKPDGRLVLQKAGKSKFNWSKVASTLADIGKFIFKLL